MLHFTYLQRLSLCTEIRVCTEPSHSFKANVVSYQTELGPWPNHSSEPQWGITQAKNTTLGSKAPCISTGNWYIHCYPQYGKYLSFSISHKTDLKSKHLMFKLNSQVIPCMWQSSLCEHTLFTQRTPQKLPEDWTVAPSLTPDKWLLSICKNSKTQKTAS